MPEINSDEYLIPCPGGRIFSRLDEARAAALRPGDTILLRELDHIAPPGVWSDTPSRGRWRLRRYELGDGQSGKLLMINERDAADPDSIVPPPWELRLDLPGWYAIWFGVPRVVLKPLLGPPSLGGIDAALDDDPAFVHVFPERGTRKGRVMGPHDVEVMCYWKCAALDGRSLRLRVPYGTFISFPWGLVRGSLSALRLVRLSDQQADAYRRDVRDPKTKKVFIPSDGFSHYWTAGRPGTADIDQRYAKQYRDSDVKGLIFQAPATAVTHWPSRIAPVAGDDVPPDGWKTLRLGDKRAHDYLTWACSSGNEGFAVMSRICRGAGLELHAGLRMNLFFRNSGIFGGEIEELANGRVWIQHPEYRNPDSAAWDYAHPGVRQFVLDLMMEMVQNYDVDGLSMDFTRWPPIADPNRHDFDVLTSFVIETRARLDEIARRKGRSLALSAMVVEGYHALMPMKGQKIDLEAWLRSGALDFICVQAWEHGPFQAMAKKYGAGYFPIQDVRTIRTSGEVEDPDWRQEDRVDEDPLPGEELEDSPHLNSLPDPLEYDEIALKWQREGADGICAVNNFLGWRSTGRLGHAREMQQRVQAGKVWAQEVGPAIRILDLEKLQADLQLVEPLGGAAPGRVRLTVRNTGAIAAAGAVRLHSSGRRKARVVGDDRFAFELKPSDSIARDFAVEADSTPGTIWFETSSDSMALFPARLKASVPWPVARVDGLASLSAIGPKLGPPVPVKDGEEVLAEVRVAAAGDELAVDANVFDRRITQADVPWDGSCVEVFGSTPGTTTIGQIYLLPASDERPAVARRELRASRPPEPRVRLDTRRTATGYELRALIPLELLAIEPASEAFLLEFQVTAALTAGTACAAPPPSAAATPSATTDRSPAFGRNQHEDERETWPRLTPAAM